MDKEKEQHMLDLEKKEQQDVEIQRIKLIKRNIVILVAIFAVTAIFFFWYFNLGQFIFTPTLRNG